MHVKIVVACRHERTASPLAASVKFEIPLLASQPIENGRNRASAWNDERVLVRQQSTLRSNAGKRWRAVWLLDVFGACFVIDPKNIAGLLVECIDERTHKWPNACSEVNLIAVDDWSAPCGPS